MNEHVSHAKFRVVFTTLDHSVAAQNNQSAVVPMENTVAARIWDFTRMNHHVFLGSKSDEDPQEFLDTTHKVIDIMGVTSSESAKLAVYQL